MARRVLFWIVCLAVAGAACAQEPADALTGFEQAAQKRNAEWTTLATNLEQRVARLLPCDPRVAGAIEEVNRASDARIMALTTYWMAVSGKSKSQVDAIRKLQMAEDNRKGEWTADREGAARELASVADQNGYLAVSVNRQAALGSAQKSLTAATQAMRQIETEIQQREMNAAQLSATLRQLLAAAEGRQAAIEAELKAVATEGTRWSAYYAARLARGQTECIITNPGTAAPAAPRPRAGKKQ